MTSADLPRLAGLLHHLPDARDLRTVDRDGAVRELYWRAEPVYAAVPELVELATRQAAELSSLRLVLRLPASTPWPDVLARARKLADLDPGRTLDGETGVRDG